MQTKKRIKIALIILLMLVEVFTIHLMYKSTELKGSELPKVKIKNENNISKKQFAIMLETSAGSKEYENKDTDYPDALPTEGYKFNIEKSGCIDINGKEVKGILSYDYNNYTLTLTASNTVYCYLYYDVLPKMHMKAVILGNVIGEDNQKRVEKVEFVDYIPENLESEEIVAHYDLSDTTKGTEANSVIGWLVANGNKVTINSTEVDLYDLYIGSKSKIYGTNMTWAFYNMTNLKAITFDNLDTSEVTNMSYMFYNCTNLTSLDLSNFDTPNVTNMASMFSGCSNLTSLDLSNFDTSQVTNMASMFSGCSNLTTLNLSNFDTSQVTNMGYMFASCRSLTALDLSNFDTSKVTNMQSIFMNCTNLTSLDVSNFDTSKVTDMINMFYNCSSLSSLGLSNFDTSQVTSMHQMFSGCSNLTSLDLSSFDTSQVTTMSYMFYKCSNLTTIDMRLADFGKVTSYSYMLSSVPTTATMHVKAGQENFVTSRGFKGTIVSH